MDRTGQQEEEEATTLLIIVNGDDDEFCGEMNKRFHKDTETVQRIWRILRSPRRTSAVTATVVLFLSIGADDGTSLTTFIDFDCFLEAERINPSRDWAGRVTEEIIGHGPTIIQFN